jgi:hypothetical protein
MSKVKSKIRYAKHPYVNALMSRSLAEKRVRPDFVNSVANMVKSLSDEFCNGIRARADARYNNVVAKANESLMKEGK